MASPDKEAAFKVTRSSIGDGKIFTTQEEAEAEARNLAKINPNETFTILRAISEFKAGEAPVERTAYRQAASRKAE